LGCGCALPVRKASGFPIAIEKERLCLGRPSRKKNSALDGKPEALRTGVGTAVKQLQPFLARYLLSKT
jgi:hypothetical protein